MLRQTINLRGHTVLDELDSRSVVLDCGANRGDFARMVIERYGCRVISLEPNPSLFEKLPEREGVVSLPYALGDHDGSMAFAIGENDEGSSIVATPDGHHSTIDVQVRTIASVLKEVGVQTVDLLKLDIEGAEIGLLNNTPDDVLRRIKQLTVEFHDFNKYVSTEEVYAVLNRLRKLDFVVCRMTTHAHGDVLMFNKKRVRSATLKSLMIRGPEKYLLGIKRVFYKKLSLQN